MWGDDGDFHACATDLEPGKPAYKIMMEIAEKKRKERERIEAEEKTEK